MLIALAACALVAACSSGGDSKATLTPAPVMTVEEAANRGQYGVGVTTLDLVDPSRPTAENREVPASPDRRIAVEVWYPAASTATAPEQRDAPLDESGGPYPLIIFAHGVAFRRQSVGYTQHLASHGYIVASPDFPQTRIDAPGGPRLWGVLDQPADVSFVIDQMLARSAAGGGPFAGDIDADRIGMTGHSLGGLTTMLTVYGPMRDSRIKAAAPVSPIGCLMPTTLQANGVPLMVINGTREKVVDPATSQLAYDEAGAPKYHVQIIGADHARFADADVKDDDLGPDIVDKLLKGDLIPDALKTAQGTGADVTTCAKRTTTTDELVSGDRQRELLNTIALPFFDANLRGDPSAARFLSETLPSLPGIRLESEVAAQPATPVK
jgi:predicted dienelactone hydrolase